MTKFIGQWVRAVKFSRPSAFPAIISDHMDALLHPADGQRYDSKSAFRRVTRDHGLVEMGNDAPIGRPAYEPEGVRADIEQSIQMLNEGYQPEPVESASTLDGAAVETRFIE
ncbi:MAG: hypothetical protein EBR34_16520 [Sphingomonadaceae bacterium]|nr:hypothetical protein [Sphingomonadaceae bacterium]